MGVLDNGIAFSDQDAEELRRRIESRITVDPFTGCWNWPALSAYGYGRLSFYGRDFQAHRAAYAAYVSPVPSSLFVCHKCDNRACVNPDHLFLGTARDNVLDAFRKGRLEPPSFHGEKHPLAKMTRLKVMEARRCWAAGQSAAELAGRFGVSTSTIRRIVSGKYWAHVKYRPKRE